MVKKASQKRKKADKSKVQLKGSALKTPKKSIKLPRGLNVTNATVKTKTIVVQRQCKPAELARSPFGSPLALTKKKLTFHDLLRKLGNLSLSTRIQALEGLSELLLKSQHQDLLRPSNLSAVIFKIMPMLSQTEAKLRSLATTFLQRILTQAEAGDLKPLHSVICVHLTCAMSHIDTDIKRGSLKVLDTVLQTMPTLLIKHHVEILPLCLNHISAGVTSLQSKSDIVERMASVLLILDKVRVDAQVTKVFSNNVKYVEGQANFFPLHGSKNLMENVPLSELKNTSKISTGGFSLDCFFKKLLPVLLDVWCECFSTKPSGEEGGTNHQPKRKQPAGKFKQEEEKQEKRCSSLLNPDQVNVMDSVVTTILLVYELRGSDEDDGNTTERIHRQILNWFPYEVHGGRRNAKKRKLAKEEVEDAQDGREATLLNLKVALLSVTLMERKSSQDGQTLSGITSFLSGICESSDANIHLTKVIKILRRFLTMATRDEEDKAGSSFDAMLKLLCTGSLSNSSIVLELGCEALLSNIHLPSKQRIVELLTLPTVLKTASCEHLKTLVELKKRNYELPSEILSENLNDVLSQLKNCERVQEVCRMLALLLRNNGEEKKKALRCAFQECLEQATDSLSFCLNVLAA